MRSATSRLFTFLLVGAVAAPGCTGAGDAAGAASAADPAEASGTRALSGPAPVNVAVDQIETSSLTARIELSGRLDPWVEVRVASELGGRVEQVGFDKGAFVREGQILARVGTDLYQAELQEAEALLTGAEATYNRARQLVERQAVPKQNAIDATTAYEAAKARVAQSRLRLDRSIVRAPVSGVATTREVEPGEVVPPGAPVTTVHRLDRLKATVGIPENDIGYFKVGGAASVRVDAWPDRTFEGRVHFVAPSAIGSTRTFQAEVAIENRDGALRPGMIGRVTLVRQTYDEAVVIPRDVVQERDVGTVAIVLDGEVARVRRLALGAVEGDRVLVKEGLAAGEWLIVTGHRGLIDGQRVAVVERRQ